MKYFISTKKISVIGILVSAIFLGYFVQNILNGPNQNASFAGEQPETPTPAAPESNEPPDQTPESPLLDEPEIWFEDPGSIEIDQVSVPWRLPKCPERPPTNEEQVFTKACAAAMNGDLAAVKTYVQAGGRMVKAEASRPDGRCIRRGRENDPENQKFLLSCAAWTCRLEVMEYLMKNGADSAALKHASKIINRNNSPECVDRAMLLLLEHGADPAEIVSRAISENKPALIEAAIKHGADVNAGLRTSAFFGNPDAAEIFLAHGAKLEQPQTRDSGSTPLLAAAQAGNAETFKFLLQKGANLKAVNRYGQTALHLAVNGWYGERDDGGCTEIINLTLARQGGLDLPDNEGNTPLHLAAKWGHSRAVNFLLGKGALISLKNRKGQTPLALAIAEIRACGKCRSYERAEYDKVVAPLIAKGATLKEVTDKQAVISYAAYNRWWRTMIALSAAGVDVAQACRGQKALPLAAAAAAKPAEFEFFLKLGYGINTRSPENGTPLTIACAHGNDELAQYLLKRGADPNAADGNRDTSLHHAAAWSNAQTVKLLLQRGARADARGELGRTPLMWAVGVVESEVKETRRKIVILLKHGARINLRDYRGATPLLNVRNSEALEPLLENGADIKDTDDEGFTILHIAANLYLNDASVELLLKRGADPNARTKEGWTPLMYASTRRKAELLLQSGADINARNNEGKTVLQAIESYHEREDVAAYLRERGAK